MRYGAPAQRVGRQLDVGISQIDVRRPAATRGQDGRHRHRPSLGGPAAQDDIQPIRGRRHRSAQLQRCVSVQTRAEEHDVDLPAGPRLAPPDPARRRGDLEQPPLTARLQMLPGLRRRQVPPAGAGRLRHPCPHLSPGNAGHHPEPGGAARFDLQTHHDPRGEVGAPRVAGLQVGSGRLTAISLGAASNSSGLIDHLDGRAVDQAWVEPPDPGASAYLQGPGAQPAHRVDTDVQS